MDKHNDFVVWQGYEYEHKQKTPDWYWALAIISVSFALGAIFFGNYLFAVLIVIAGFSVAIHAYEKPSIKEFRVDFRGIRVGDRLYPYGNIDSFYVDDRLTPPHLFFELKRAFVPLIIIPIGTVKISMLRDILSEHLPEREHVIPFSQKIFDYFGF